MAFCILYAMAIVILIIKLIIVNIAVTFIPRHHQFPSLRSA